MYVCNLVIYMFWMKMWLSYYGYRKFNGNHQQCQKLLSASVKVTMKDRDWTETKNDFFVIEMAKKIWAAVTEFDQENENFHQC